MKLLVIYRPLSEHARSIDEFVREFSRRNPSARLEMVDIDTRDGMATASIYDVMQYPAILALRNDGSALNVWQGPVLPLMDEVAGYTVAA